jgi:hypothetical protein
VTAHRNETAGPVLGHEWPEQLVARLVSKDETRVAGYDVVDDLAEHWRFSDLLFLALTGELPNEREGRVFEYVLMNLAPASVARASVHGAVLTRVCDASQAATAASAAMGAAEEARFVVARVLEAHAKNDFDALRDPRGGPATSRIVQGLSRRGLTLTLPLDLVRDAVLLLALVAIGFTDSTRLECAYFVARSPLALAEAMQQPTRAFREYPMKLPHFEYAAAGEAKS